MSFPWSDFCGMVGGFGLAIPSVRDQGGRLRTRWQEHGAEAGRLRRMWGALTTASERERTQYNGWDTLCMAAGSLFLILAFLVRAIAG